MRRADGCHRTTGHPAETYFVLATTAHVLRQPPWGAIPQASCRAGALRHAIARAPRPASRDAFQIRTVTFIPSAARDQRNASARSRRQRQITTRLIAVAARARRDSRANGSILLRDPLILR